MTYDKLVKVFTAMQVMANKTVDADRGYIDATIQRFEFSVELFWKLLKRLLLDLGQETNFPKAVLREAFATGLIDQDQAWIQMLNDRNQTSHTYDEELADVIYGRIKKIYIPLMQTTLAALEKAYFM